MTKQLRYLCTLLLLVVASVAWGDEVTYSLTPNKTSTGSSATSYITTLTEFTHSGISWKMNQWNPSTLQVKTNQSNAANEFRFYNTSAFSGKITKVVITFSALTVSDASKLMFLGGTSTVTATTGGTAGTWDSNAKTLTWTPGSSDNFTYFAFYQNGKAANGNNYLAESNAIVVTYETSGGSSTTTIEAPTFTVPEGAVTAGTVVNIDNPNDKYIYYYTTDGTTPDVDDDLLVQGTTTMFDTTNGLTINTTTTLKAIAVDEDVNKSAVASATYIIPFANIAALTAASISSTAATGFVTLSDAVVTYVNGSNAYIQDASGAVLLYLKDHGLTAGDVLNGTATVTYALRYGNPQLTDISGITPTQGETTPMPTEVAAANWNKTFNNELSKYYKITDATITENDGKYYISLGGQSVQLYGQGEAKNFTLSNLTKKYTIVGFPTLFVSGENTTLELQIFEVPEIQTYQITPVVNNSAYGTVEYDNGVIIATPAEGYRFATPAYSVTSGTATITQDGNEFTVDAQTDCTVQINFEAIPSHTATFSVNGTTTTQDFAEDAAISFPSTPADVNGKTFVGWTTNTIEGTTNTAPTFVTSATMGTKDVTYYAVFATLENAGSSETITDVLTLETTGIKEGTTTYSDWYEKTVTSRAVYAGQSAGGNNSIQLRSANSNSGIISTASGGKLKKIKVDWNPNTTSGRRIRVYGKNTAYTAVADVYSVDKQGTQIGGNGPEFDITYGKSTELTVNGDYEYIGIRSMDGALYLNSISITWENSTPATYSGYCTTVVAPVVPDAPIVFHDSGATYEGSLTVPMFAQEGATIKYTMNGGDEQTYSAPVELGTGETTITAWAELDGVKSSEVTKKFTVVPKETSDIALSGYYTIQTSEGKYMNVAGRRTVTLNADTKSAGTVLKVTVENGQVKELRSQAVDLPRYAERAMSYVPDLVKAIVKKLGENGVENNVIGEPGTDKVVKEFMNKFDYHLYLEQPEGSKGYRIYGKTPSMSLVVDFYAQNKEVIDGRLPYLEDFVKNVFKKVVELTGHGGSFVDSFNIHDLWESMGGTASGLTEPEDGNEAAISKFYEEVLSSEKNVWDFAYQTSMIYWDRVESFLNEHSEGLGDYSKYISRIKNIQPNFKYYLVPDASGLDIISEGNEAIMTDAASAAWTLKECTTFGVTLPVEKNVTICPTTSGGESTSSEYYGTLYTDFAYDLPDGVTAYKVEGINPITNKSGVTTALVKKSELEGTIPAQTPVLLMANQADLTLNLNTNEGSAVESELHGTDWLINEYEINSPTAEGIFTLLHELSESLAEQYEYLQRRNAGTVNNKYLFGIVIDGDFDKYYKAKTGNDMESCPVRVLNKKDDGTVAFIETWDPLANNEGFMFSEDYSEILLSMVGDVDRDGDVDYDDVTALVNIILGKATYPADADKYDFEAANVNGDGQISIADVTALVNIILGKN